MVRNLEEAQTEERRRIMDKLTSRKFWVCVSAFLASVATSISGFACDNQTIVVLGLVCSTLSAAIYAFCEAWVDSKAVDSTDIFTEDDEDGN